MSHYHSTKLDKSRRLLFVRYSLSFVVICSVGALYSCYVNGCEFVSAHRSHFNAHVRTKHESALSNSSFLSFRVSSYVGTCNLDERTKSFCFVTLFVFVFFVSHRQVVPHLTGVRGSKKSMLPLSCEGGSNTHSPY